MGCWSNAGGWSAGPDPPAPVGDRWPSTVSRSSSQRKRGEAVGEHVGAIERDRPRRSAPRRARRWRSRAGPRATPRPRSSPGRPMATTASASNWRAPMCPGRTPSTSAAPSAAKAIARGHGDRCSSPRWNDDPRTLAHPVERRPSRGRAERPHRPAPAIVDATAVGPPTPGGTPVAHLAVDALRVDEEPVGEPGETDDGGVALRLAARGHQHAGHVVGAVAVADPWLGELGVLERADRVAHGDDVLEARCRDDHVPTPAARSSDVARSS